MTLSGHRRHDYVAGDRHGTRQPWYFHRPADRSFPVNEAELSFVNPFHKYSGYLCPSTVIKRRPTIDDVAQAAGVSAPVVSVVLNNRVDSTIGASAETRERVQRIARELNYKPSLAGRGLAEKKTYLIGLLLSQINAPLVADVIHGVQDVAADRRYSSVVLIHNSPQQEAEEFARSQDRRVDALIVDTCDAPAEPANIERYSRLAEQSFPIMELFGHSIPDVARVNVDFEGDGRRAVEHLLALGHRDIALVIHDGYQQRRKHWSSWRFANGYQDAMKQAGLKSAIVTAPPVLNPADALVYVASGRQAAANLLALAQVPQAIISYSSRRAHGLLQGLKERGICVPDDLSVVGFCDRDVATLADPPLTSLIVAGRRAGSAAAEAIFHMLDGKTLGKKEVLVPSQWMLQSSTQKAAQHMDKSAAE